MIRLPPLGAAGALSVLLALLSAGRGASAQAPGSAGPPPVGTAPSEPEPSEQASDALDPGAPEAGGAEAEAAALAAVLAEVSSTGNAAEAAVADLEQMSLHVYGFADFTYTHWLKGAIPGVKPTFAVGNFNVYLSTEFGSNWRSLAEVRFLYLPHGAAPAEDPSGAPLNTTVPDHADIQRPLRWGGVEIERVWLEYAFDPLLTIRGGQWLTPYGIWNVDHGSPTIIATYRPYIIGEALLPERQTGLELHGSGYLGPVKLGYHLTLSNGRGPTDAYADLDGNKALGGRLFAENDSVLGNIVLGASAYRGRYSSTQLSLGAAGFSSEVLERYDELGYAADLKWVYEGLHLQSEVVVQEVIYDDEFRPSDAFGRAGFLPDYRRWGGYALVGYRTPFFGIMPYVNVEYYDDGPNGFFGKVPAYWFGVNIRPIPSIVLKAQYLYADAEGTPAFGDIEPFQFVTTQAAWSF